VYKELVTCKAGGRGESNNPAERGQLGYKAGCGEDHHQDIDGQHLIAGAPGLITSGDPPRQSQSRSYTKDRGGEQDAEAAKSDCRRQGLRVRRLNEPPRIADKFVDRGHPLRQGQLAELIEKVS
jgi:hypothetical protein